MKLSTKTIGLIFILLFSLSFAACEGCDDECSTGTEVYVHSLTEDLPLPIIVTCENCEDLTSVEDAIANWNTALDKELFLYSEEETPIINIRVVPNLDEVRERFPDLIGGHTWAFFDSSSTPWTIYVISEQINNSFILAHELGHSLGLQHSSCSKSIMYRKNRWCQIITPEIIELIHTNFNTLNGE